MNDGTMTLGEKLRALRAVSGWTQPEAAERIDIEQSYLSKLENDKSVPSAEIFDSVCSTYQVTPEELLDDLDRSYVKRSLRHIPLVAARVNQMNTSSNSRRRWMLLSAAFLLLTGAFLALASQTEIIFQGERIYNYQSSAILFDDDRDRCLQSAQDGLQRDSCKRRFQAITDPDFVILNHDRGNTYRTDLDNGYRVYSFRGSSDLENMDNRVLLVAGIMAALLGLVLFWVEKRVSS